MPELSPYEALRLHVSNTTANILFYAFEYRDGTLRKFNQDGKKIRPAVMNLYSSALKLTSAKVNARTKDIHLRIANDQIVALAECSGPGLEKLMNDTANPLLATFVAVPGELTAQMCLLDGVLDGVAKHQQHKGFKKIDWLLLRDQVKDLFPHAVARSDRFDFLGRLHADGLASRAPQNIGF